MSDTPISEQDILSYWPFEGDFGEPSDKKLSDKIVTCRKIVDCHICTQCTLIGSRKHKLVMVIDGKLEQYNFCQDCCNAMGLSWSDSGKTLESRHALRRQP